MKGVSPAASSVLMSCNPILFTLSRSPDLQAKWSGEDRERLPLREGPSCEAPWALVLADLWGIKLVNTQFSRNIYLDSHAEILSNCTHAACKDDFKKTCIRICYTLSNLPRVLFSWESRLPRHWSLLLNLISC